MLIVKTVILCLIFFLICYVNTGSDEKNLIGLRSYPLSVQEKVRNNDKFKDKVKPVNLVKVFISNLILFSIIFLIVFYFGRSNGFIKNFIDLLICGQIINAFDYYVIDLLWWRNSSRIRFSFIPDKKEYQDKTMHYQSFLRGIIMYILVAVIDAIILTII